MTPSTLPPPPAPITGSPPQAPVSRPSAAHRISVVWIIPLVAALLGLWLVFRYYEAKGPEIKVRFETAEGLIAGKTPVLCRSVPIGTVKLIELSGDQKGVVITL